MKQIQLIRYDDKEKKEDNDIKILDELISKIQPKENVKETKKSKKKKKKKKKKNKNKDSLFDKYGFRNLFEDTENKAEQNVQPKPKINKDDENFYEYRFSSSLILLKDLLKDINELADDSKKTLEKFKDTIQRGSFTAITNQTGNMSNLYSTKLNVIKEIANVNKQISDLEIKRIDKKNKNGGEGMDDISTIENIYEKLMDDGLSIRSPLEGNVSKKDKKKKKKNKKNDDETTKDKPKIKNETLFDEEDEDVYDFVDNDDSDKDLDDIVKDLIDSGEIEFTDNELALKYENRDIKVIIDKNIDTGRWNFRAVDESNNTVYDYPLPNKKSVGKVKFDIPKGIAKDQLGNVYELRYEKK